MADNDKEMKTEISELLRGANDSGAARRALGFLFPKVAKVLGEIVPGTPESGDALVRKRRMASSESAAAYFRLDPFRMSWGKEEIESLLKSNKPQEALSEALQRVQLEDEVDRTRMRRLLFDEIGAAFNSELTLTQELLNAIVQLSSDYIRNDPERDGSIFELGNLEQLSRVVVKGVQTLTGVDAARIVASSISVATDLTLLCHALRSILGDRNPGGATEKLSPVFGNRSEEVRNVLLDRVRLFASSGKFWSQTRPQTVLWWWWGNAEEVEVIEFLTEQIGQPKTLPFVLNATVSSVYSSTGDFETVQEVWRKIVDLDELTDRAQGLLQKGTESEKDAARQFLSAVAREDHFGGRPDILSQPVTTDSILAYTRWKYPDLPVSESLTELLLRDLNLSAYPSLESLDIVVERAKRAVDAYREENPDWFKTGTDFLTKSLGFIDPDFLRKHGFAQRTRAAFEKYAALVDR